MSNDFTHLHVHSTYSTLDGIIRFPQLMTHLKEHGMTSCALTDHGGLHGLIDFYRECTKNNIKPLLGVEAYCTWDEDGIEDNKFKTHDNYHMIILAMNEIGLSNLYWLTNNANINNFYYRPRISYHNLLKRSEGLIITSSCLGGLVGKAGRAGLPKSSEYEVIEDIAIQRINEFKNLLGNRFYLEIQDNEMKEQQMLNSFILKASKTEQVPLVITADAHYLKKEDHPTHSLIMAQQLKKTLPEYQDESNDMMKYGTSFYIKSPKEMLQGALKYKAEEAFWNTLEISKQCNIKLNLGTFEVPKFDIEKQKDFNEFQEWKASKWECDE